MSEAYELSRQIFELNASRVGSVMIDPIEGVDTFDAADVALMQMELARWQVRNFGVSCPDIKKFSDEVVIPWMKDKQKRRDQ